MFDNRLANVFFYFLVPGTSLAIWSGSENEGPIGAKNDQSDVSTVSFNACLVGFEIEEPICIISEVVNENIIIEWSHLTLLCYHVVIAKNFVLQDHVFREPALKKVASFLKQRSLDRKQRLRIVLFFDSRYFESLGFSKVIL